MTTLVDPFEVRAVVRPEAMPEEHDVDVEAETLPEPEPRRPGGVSALSWKRARAWSAEE